MQLTTSNTPVFHFSHWSRNNIAAANTANRRTLRRRPKYSWMARAEYRLEQRNRALFPIGCIVVWQMEKHVVVAYACSASVLILMPISEVLSTHFKRQPHFGWHYNFPKNSHTEMTYYQDLLDAQIMRGEV